MSRSIRCTLALVFFASTLLSAQPAIQWDKTIGSPLDDAPRHLEQTSDGGYIMGGTTNSGIGGDKSEYSKGSLDYWIIKLSSEGSLEWEKTIGGPANDSFSTIHQTADGGYIVGGSSSSPIGSEKSERSRGNSDYWIVKLDKNGDKVWDKTIGGPGGDILNDVRQTDDGGYILAGSSSSGIGGEKTEAELGQFFSDFWIVKLSATGTLEWERTLGTSGPDGLQCMTLTSDGGYVFGGNQGYQEQSSGYYLMKVSAAGTKQWEKIIGGVIDSYGYIYGYADINDVQQTPDGGFILGGTSNQGAGGHQTESSLIDYWIVKLDADLSVEWDNVIATAWDADGKGGNYFAKLVQKAGGGYTLLGYSGSFAGGDKTEDSHGNGVLLWSSDFWLVRLNASGTVVWDKTIGGAEDERAYSIGNTSDGGMVLMGSSTSNAGFAKTENGKGGTDFWIVKLAPDEPSLPVTLKTFSAKKESTSAVLSWQTTSETRSSHFEIQHSTNGKTWTALGAINAKGESSEIWNYQYIHSHPATGENLYRLKMVDTDGSFALSKINRLKFAGDFSIHVYPNPAVETMTVQAGDWSKVKSVEVLNSIGKAVYHSGSIPVQTINAKELPRGLYFVKVSLNDGSVTTQKLAVVH
ncbi:T9SS type A sorting domain-containing protein [Dyadobacter bucti]|uniref:T9SS type A sorting domain-containing protein n=1 Tax=Dyadobacter bucti TaxID=2572203 RepID=UPI001107C1C4|nr:T9SS type A sorting domain-containing protein [Dyadobacter bucti]